MISFFFFKLDPVLDTCLNLTVLSNLCLFHFWHLNVQENQVKDFFLLLCKVSFTEIKRQM